MNNIFNVTDNYTEEDATENNPLYTLTVKENDNTNYILPTELEMTSDRLKMLKLKSVKVEKHLKVDDIVKGISNSIINFISDPYTTAFYSSNMDYIYLGSVIIVFSIFLYTMQKVK